MVSFWLSATALASFCSLAFSQYIDPTTVPDATKDQWCSSQIAQCPLICLQEAGNSAGTNANDCDPTTLTFNCICSNGLSPNSSEYSQTVPYYICTQNNENCVANCGTGNNDCASSCREDHPCGAQDPTRINTSTLTSMSATATGEGGPASTASDGAVYTGFGNSDSSATGSASSDNASVRLVLNTGELYGLGLIATGVFFGFTTLL